LVGCQPAPRWPSRSPTAGAGWPRLLEGLELEPHLVHPGRCKAIASVRLKNDKVDVWTLAQLLRADLLPEAWIAPQPVRDQRALLRHRVSLVRLSTASKNRVHAVLADRGVREHTSLWTAAGQAWLAGSAQVIGGDARDLIHLLPGELHGKVALVLTSPPYTHAAYNHGQVRTRPGQGVEKWNRSYSSNPENLGNTNPTQLLAGVEQILAGCARVLRPGGLVVLTTRPWRFHGALVDLPGQVARAAERAGLRPLERNVALLVGLRGERLVGRASFFQIDNTRKARAAGLPLHVVAHEDLLVFRSAG
jgi:hypothetical protein